MEICKKNKKKEVRGIRSVNKYREEGRIKEKEEKKRRKELRGRCEGNVG